MPLAVACRLSLVRLLPELSSLSECAKGFFGVSPFCLVASDAALSGCCCLSNSCVVVAASISFSLSLHKYVCCMFVCVCLVERVFLAVFALHSAFSINIAFYAASRFMVIFMAYCVWLHVLSVSEDQNIINIIVNNNNTICLAICGFLFVFFVWTLSLFWKWFQTFCRVSLSSFLKLNNLL